MAAMPKFEYTVREVTTTNREAALYAFIAGCMIGGFVAWLVLKQ